MAWPWRCWLRGHAWLLVFERAHVFLECGRCGVRTEGWHVGAWIDYTPDGIKPLRFH